MIRGVNAHMRGQCAACGEPNATPSWLADGLGECSGEESANCSAKGSRMLWWGTATCCGGGEPRLCSGEPNDGKRGLGALLESFYLFI
jgi:hypothetical protein